MHLCTSKFVGFPSQRRWATQQASLPTWQKKGLGKEKLFDSFSPRGQSGFSSIEWAFICFLPVHYIVTFAGTVGDIFTLWRRTVSNFWLETVIPSLRSLWQIGRLSFLCWVLFSNYYGREANWRTDWELKWPKSWSSNTQIKKRAWR